MTGNENGLGEPMGREVDAELSSRKRNVLRLAMQGHTDYEIAERLLLQPATVRRDLRSALAELAALPAQTGDRSGARKRD
jgi:DNA-binding NarL/FixJ family response regulator